MAIYLDHAATTPLREEAAEARARVERSAFGNASSLHGWGRAARSALEEARERLAGVLGANRREIVFTGSGTEADNLAVLGRWRAVAMGTEGNVGAGSSRHAPGVVCSAVEHKAVLGAAAAAGENAVRLPVDGEGRLELSILDAVLAGSEPAPAIVSIMWGNNEVGTLQPVAAAAQRCRAAGVTFHSDAVQALGRVRVRVDEVPVDLLTVSAHKIGGPKGIGALYVREGVALEPLVHGGGQEHGLRAGTADVGAAVAFAVAAELAEAEREAESERLRALRDRLESSLRDGLPDLFVNGGGAERLPHILNVSVPGVDQEALLMALDMEGVGASSGSACQSGTLEMSHVLAAMGQDTAATPASLRLSLGRTTTAEDIEAAAAIVREVVVRLRALAVR